MKNDEITDIENKHHIEKTYTDKAIKLLKICIGIFIFSLLTYLIGIFLYSTFDFGLIFETISFIFIVLALKKINQNDLKSGKKYSIIAMIPIGWLIIYDLFNLLVNISEVMLEVIIYYTSFSQFFFFLEPYLFDVLLVASIILLYKTYSYLSRADGSKKADNYIDSFYDKL